MKIKYKIINEESIFGWKEIILIHIDSETATYLALGDDGEEVLVQNCAAEFQEETTMNYRITDYEKIEWAYSKLHY